MGFIRKTLELSYFMMAIFCIPFQQPFLDTSKYSSLPGTCKIRPIRVPETIRRCTIQPASTGICGMFFHWLLLCVYHPGRDACTPRSVQAPMVVVSRTTQGRGPPTLEVSKLFEIVQTMGQPVPTSGYTLQAL